MPARKRKAPVEAPAEAEVEVEREHKTRTYTSDQLHDLSRGNLVAYFCPEVNGATYDEVEEYTGMKQSRANMFHLLAAPAKEKKDIKSWLVPPMAVDWPVDKFVQNMKPLKFLEVVLANPQAIDVIRNEMLTEATAMKLTKQTRETKMSAVFDDRPDDERPLRDAVKKPDARWPTAMGIMNAKGSFWCNHFQERLSWCSWSAGIQLEYSIKQRCEPCFAAMQHCSNFFQCLVKQEFAAIQKSYDDAKDHKKWQDGKRISGEFVEFLTLLKELLDKVMTPLFVELNPSFNKNLIQKDIKDFMKTLPWFRGWIGDSTGVEVLVTRAIRESDVSVASAKVRVVERYKFRLQRPKHVSETELLIGFRKLINIVYLGDDKKLEPSTTYPLGKLILFEDTPADYRRAAAAALLLQAAVGSRARGILAVNIIDRCSLTLSEDKLGDDPKDIRLSYATMEENLVIVRRLTKSRDPTKKAVWDYLNSNEWTKEDDKDMEVEDVAEIATGYRKGRPIEAMEGYLERRTEEANKVITKPLIWQLFDLSTYYKLWDSSKLYDKDDEGEISSPVDVFFTLLASMRACVLDPILAKGTDWATMSLSASEFAQPAVQDAKIHDPEVTKVVKSWVKRMNTVAASVFPPAIANGSHDMRRVYVAYGYELFAKDRMKETGWANRVLAHDSIAVSNIYTSLKIDLGVAGHERSLPEYTIAQLEMVLKQLLDVGAKYDELKKCCDRKPGTAAAAPAGYTLLAPERRDERDHKHGDDEDKGDDHEPPDEIDEAKAVAGPAPGYARLTDKSGRDVDLPKLPRLRRGTDQDEELRERRYAAVFELLTSNDVAVNCHNLQQMGIPKLKGRCGEAAVTISKLMDK